MADLLNSLITTISEAPRFVVTGGTCLIIGIMVGLFIARFARANGRDDEPAYEDGEPRKE